MGGQDYWVCNIYMKSAPRIDFSVSPRARRFHEIRVWLVIGGLFLSQILWNVWRYIKFEHQEEALNFAIERTLQEAHTSELKFTAKQAQVMKSVQIIVSQLSVPWEEMLLAIESSRLPSVVVEKLQPRPSQSIVTMTVSGADFKSISEFVNALRQKAVFQDVQVQSESVSESGAFPWLAVIDMRWIATK